jgi:hypothetical protein
MFLIHNSNDGQRYEKRLSFADMLRNIYTFFAHRGFHGVITGVVGIFCNNVSNLFRLTLFLSKSFVAITLLLLWRLVASAGELL